MSHPSDFNTSMKTKRTMKMTVAAAALAVLAGGLGLGFGAVNDGPVGAATAAATETATPRQLNLGAPFSFADLVEKVSPAVVSVVVEREAGPRVAADTDEMGPFGDLFRQFGQGQGRQFQFGPNGQGRGFQFGPNNRQGQREAPVRRSQARGAGFIIEADGYIVTNNHVVDGSSKIMVKLPDGREFQAKVVGTDKDSDVALLKVDGVRNLPTVSFGDDRNVRVGDWVVAVGNPYGLGGTVTAGIVSSIHRDIGNGPYTDYLQIDAPINQGNSGGPTFDVTGRVVGMNTAIFSPSGGSVGIGFAIPASTIQSIVTQLKDSGSVTRGWLGVQIQTLTPEIASSMGAANAKGAIVASVVPNSPASKAGLRQGDVIVGLNGGDVADSRDLTRRVANLAAGGKADFSILRDGKKETMTATIAKRDDQASSNDTRPRGPNARPSADRQLGMDLAPVTPDTRDEFGLDDMMKGVVVTSVDPDSDAATKGLRAGDVIMRVGSKEVNSPADVRRSIADAKQAGRTSVLMLVGGMDGQHFVPVKIA